MTDNTSTLAGYTQEVHAFADEGIELYLLIQPDTDTGGHFTAWDMDAQEFLLVTGWMFTVEAQ